MILLYGADTANRIKEESLAMLEKLDGYVPTLGIIRVGRRADDISYEKSAIRKLDALGLNARVFEFAESISSEEFTAEFKSINEDKAIDGILLFRPLPKHIDEKKIIEVMDEGKDLDGISFRNIAKVFAGESDGFAPCTAEAVMKMLESNEIDLTGKRVVVLGRSMVIGKPVSLLALNKNATVTVCHSRTENLKQECKKADILIVAVGRAGMINDEYIKKGATVIDVGINFTDGRLTGDVDLENVKNAAMATPVPSGVGAVTASVLAEHLIRAAIRRRTGKI